MTEMIERVAAAIWKRAIADRSNVDAGTWKMQDPGQRAYFRDAAEAAIEAMRELTGRMENAACDAGGVGDWGGHERASFTEEWAAAIDAALGKS